MLSVAVGCFLGLKLYKNFLSRFKFCALMVTRCPVLTLKAYMLFQVSNKLF